MKKVLFLTVMLVSVFSLGYSQNAAVFPSDFLGTWKRDNFDNTLTFNPNFFTDSAQPGSRANFVRMSGNSYTYAWASNDREFTLTFRFVNGNIEISGDSGTDQRNWNGIWKKQNPEPIQTVQGSNFADKQAWLQAFVKTNGNYLIELGADESITPLIFEYSGKSNVTITIKGNGTNRTIRLSSNGIMFTVASDVTLILENITLRGNSNNRNTIVSVKNGGILRMNDSSSITGSGDGGILINGTVYMNGGTISGNTGDGVTINIGGTFNMSGGTISNNTRDGVSGTEIFIMSGGTISGNGSNGVSGTMNFTMNDGVISGNSGHGAYLKRLVTMNGGTISNNKKYGIYIYAGSYENGGYFTMNNGKISNNSGGGVYLDTVSTFLDYKRCTLDMKGGTISGNTARNGGGVLVSSTAIFTMSGGTISNNTASENGGGVYVSSGGGDSWGRVHGTFTMSGGTISNNTASENGGGVFVQGSFTKTGGIIIGYSSDQINGNVIKSSSGSALSFRGHAIYAGSSSTVIKIKENTAGSADNMSYNQRDNTFNGAWDN